MNQSDVIVVLACGVLDDGTLPLNAKLRIQKAKELYDQKRAPKLLVSGKWSEYRKRHLPPCTEAEAMKKYALTLGFKEQDVLKEEESHNTLANAHYVKKLHLLPNEWKRIIVVTSDFHVPRAEYIFRTYLGSAFDAAIVAAESDVQPLRKYALCMQEFAQLLALKHAWAFVERAQLQKEALDQYPSC